MMYADESDSHDNNVLVGIGGSSFNVDLHDEHGQRGKLYI